MNEFWILEDALNGNTVGSPRENHEIIFGYMIPDVCSKLARKTRLICWRSFKAKFLEELLRKFVKNL